MVEIVSQQEVENRMGLAAGPANSVILSAITASYLRMQGELDTVFSSPTGTVTDVFLLDSTKTGVVPDGMFRLRLKYGFVRTGVAESEEDPVPEVLCGVEQDDISMEVTGYKWDYHRGILYVPEDYADKFLSVEYRYGFDTGDEAPDSLKEAILGYAPVCMQFSKPRGKGDVKQDYSAAADHALAVLAPLRRKIGFALAPVY